MTKIVFLRHSLPAVHADVPPEDWGLSSAGALAARNSVLDVPISAKVLSSTERKAIETTSIITGRDAIDIETDLGFGEIQREEPVDDGFRERRAAWVAGQEDYRHAGWEAHTTAADRMSNALLHHRSEIMIVGTHGMVLTTWMVHVGLVSAGQPAVAFWQALGFPDTVTVQADDLITSGSLSFI